MAASLESVRRDMEGRVNPTPNNVGLTFDMHITVYDGGMIHINGRPVNAYPNDPAHSWLRASEYISISLNEFYRQCAQRKQKMEVA